MTDPIFKIPVLFHPDMSVWVDSSSPSPNKPKEVMASWTERFGARIQIIKPRPVTIEDLTLAHARPFVEEILSCQRANGFGNKSPQAASSFPLTTGAMVDAAREAIRNGKVAVAPCSGFHHAEWNSAMAYCTFNGLIVAARKMIEEGRARRIGILDFDQHYGNGTDQIIGQLALPYIVHFTAGKDYGYPHQAAEFLARIPKIIETMAQCDLILYQAGADPHIDDPLGGWLTNDQLQRRDRIVFETASLYQIPVAWNLAGGYQRPLRKVLDIHDNTMAACIEIFGGEDRSLGIDLDFVGGGACVMICTASCRPNVSEVSAPASTIKFHHFQPTSKFHAFLCAAR